MWQQGTTVSEENIVSILRVQNSVVDGYQGYEATYWLKPYEDDINHLPHCAVS
jgi:hypothetical protein